MGHARGEEEPHADEAHAEAAQHEGDATAAADEDSSSGDLVD
jgi:hypothetical protein